MHILTNHVDGKPITISPSSLSGAVDNPHTFWLEKNRKLPWPRGIFPSLPGGMDLALKPWYDSFRSRGVLPPEVLGQGLTGVLMRDQAQLNRWRTRSKAGMLSTVISAEVNGTMFGVTFQGMIDDALEEADGSLSVYDYKTKGSAPKPGDTDRYYGKQADGYALLFERNGRRASGKGHFAYYYPGQAQEVQGAAINSMQFGFACKVEHILTSPVRCEAIVQDLIRVLVGPLPTWNGHENCEYLKAYQTTVTAALSAQASA